MMKGRKKTRTCVRSWLTITTICWRNTTRGWVGASFEVRVDQQRKLLAALGVQSSGGIALDLGCGAGAQSLAWRS